MNKLKSADVSQIADLSKRLAAAKEAIDTRTEEVNGKIGEVNESIGELNAAIGNYNAILAEAEGLRDEIVGAMEDYESERSDKWHESDAADYFREWKGEWEGADFSEVPEVEEINEIDEIDLSHDETLDQLPTERPS